jgi:predicted MFS family arabinose efflux permease
MFVLGPTAGAVNDRLSRRTVMIIADLTRAVIVLGMIAVTAREQLWLLYMLLAAEVASAAFFEPARNAVIANIVPRSEIVCANALSSATWSFNLAVGAGIGGLVVHALGRNAAFTINSLSFLASAAFLLRMRFQEPHVEEHRHLKWTDILGLGPVIEGIQYVRGNARLTTMLFVKCGLGLMGANLVLLPVIGEREFPAAGAGVLGMSTLFMARGVGAILGSLVGGRWAGTNEPRLRRGVLVGFVLGGVCYLLFSRAPSLAWAAACIAGAHTGGSMVWVFSTTLLHLNTEDRFRGRIFAADFGLLTLAISLSAPAASVAMDHGLTPRLTAAALGFAMFLPAGLWALAQRLWREPDVV